MKINKHIEIVRSSSPRLSSLSQESCDAIFNVLSKNYSRVGITVVDDLASLEQLVYKQPDLVFLGMKFIPFSPDQAPVGPARIWLSTYLDERGIAYTGSAQLAHFLEYDKAAAKQCVLDAQLKTAPFHVIKKGKLALIDGMNLGFPLFVKPLDRGGGVGIDSDSVVYTATQLSAKVQAIASRLGADSLVEEYLPGREFSVAILKNEIKPGFAVMAVELIAPKTNGARLLSQDVKSANAEIAIKVTDLDLKRRVEALALDVFYALGARDYGRIDIRLGKDGSPHFLEANLIPSVISGYGSFPKACLINIGLGYESMILRIVRLALKRSPNPEKGAKPITAMPSLALLEAASSTM